MAKQKTAAAETISLTSDNAPRPRLHKLIIRNFRSIGNSPVEIELDEIVVLVGANNAGKSSILKAYETVMSHGSKEGKLGIQDFPNGIVDPNKLPNIELQTVVFDKAPGERWLQPLANNEFLIREQWTWDSPNKDPVRQGYDVQRNDWDQQVPWGAPNVANSKRPRPHRIDAFASPDTQANEITSLITSLLKEKLLEIKTNPDQEQSDYQLVIEKIKDLQTKAVSATEQEVATIEAEISKYLDRLFPNHLIKFDAKPELDIDKAYTPFKTSADLLMGPKDGYLSGIAHQGSGARRTLLWATLKYLSEVSDSEGTRPHVLLLDEPEICLHPSAIREARAVLYDLPQSGNWQVMITSHSPTFIDLSKDNTTIIRVFREEGKEVESTTLYRPSRAKLDADDRKNLKMLNICDPYVNEFFFGGRQIIVEGDTEYTAFSIIRDMHIDEYKDVQIIRARGKGIIPSVAKVLLQFSKQFTILHDTDTPLTVAGKGNPAWGMNKTIASVLDLENAEERVRLVACKTCFETALFGKEEKDEKPYRAFVRIQTDPESASKVKELFDFLLDAKKPKPENCIEWKKIEDLEDRKLA
ncbi:MULTISPECIES: ATP-dependent endonuclease [Pseudomonas]|uniref:ATP-dependent nuclease n=1 Tax=Pseudomonas TaxID=286 RepID=UPI000B355F6C|nr:MULTISPECIES: AAA family ATPase [Pseudomonas]PMY67038.1 energy-coupling factor transporter ATPase [Pseudomonas sp. FW126-L8]PMY68091.1 energy-coupling factor transporter ATPase [Pseudomonas sp. FW305-25]PNA78337.1 energy-coupling factor transporter ATPase [Pseudomonas sp. FW305-76]